MIQNNHKASKRKSAQRKKQTSSKDQVIRIRIVKLLANKRQVEVLD